MADEIVHFLRYSKLAPPVVPAHGNTVRRAVVQNISPPSPPRWRVRRQFNPAMLSKPNARWRELNVQNILPSPLRFRRYARSFSPAMLSKPPAKWREIPAMIADPAAALSFPLQRHVSSPAEKTVVRFRPPARWREVLVQAIAPASPVRRASAKPPLALAAIARPSLRWRLPAMTSSPDAASASIVISGVSEVVGNNLAEGRHRR